MSNFRDVVKLNRVYGAEATDSTDIDWSRLEFQKDLIKEEFEELLESLEEKDFEKLKDAIGDILVTTYGMGFMGSFDCDSLMDYIDLSNMSKVHYTWSDVERSQIHYSAFNVQSYIETVIHKGVTYYILKASETTVGSDGKQYIKDKVMKGMNFVEPSLAVDLTKGTL